MKRVKKKIWFLIAGLTLFVDINASCSAEKKQKQDLWMQYLANAEDSVEQESFADAIVSYSHAINLMEEIGENSMAAYHERGLAYLQIKDYNAAITDFSRVIENYESNPISSNLPAALNALWSRFGTYSRIHAREKADLDFTKIALLDPNFPIVEFSENTVIIKNLYLSSDHELKKIFASVMVNIGVCDKKEDVFFSHAGIVTIKMSSDFYDLLDDQCDCAALTEEMRPSINAQPRKERVSPRKLIECQKKCDDFAYSLGLGCAFCKTAMGKAACAAAVYTLKNACHWCCSDGNFYKKCIKPLAAFNPKDPAWDNNSENTDNNNSNDQSSHLPDRSLDDKDLIWNDRDLVYDWDDI